MTCSTCGSEVLVNRNADGWDWPYACTWCDRERLPEELRATVCAPAPRLTRWQHLKRALGFGR